VTACHADDDCWGLRRDGGVDSGNSALCPVKSTPAKMDDLTVVLLAMRWSVTVTLALDLEEDDL
jgi:hypothetical protein